MKFDQEAVKHTANALCDLFEHEFGGKRRGRYRISEKFMRHMMGCVRLYPETITSLQRAVFEKGLVLIDMDSYFVVVSSKTLSSYRRVGPGVVGYDSASANAASPGDDDSDE